MKKEIGKGCRKIVIEQEDANHKHMQLQEGWLPLECMSSNQSKSQFLLLDFKEGYLFLRKSDFTSR